MKANVTRLSTHPLVTVGKLQPHLINNKGEWKIEERMSQQLNSPSQLLLRLQLRES
jgi:hypothetical protein